MMRNLANPKLAGGILLLMGAAQFNVGPVKANDWMTGPDLVPDQIPYVGPRLNPTPMQLLALLGMASGVALMMDWGINMVGYGVISKEQIPSGTVSALVGLGLAATGMALMEAPAQVAIGLPTLGAGMILLYKGLLKEGVIA